MYHIIIIFIVIASISPCFSRDRQGVKKLCFYAIFNLALIDIRQIKNHAKLTNYTVHQYSKDILFLL